MDQPKSRIPAMKRAKWWVDSNCSLMNCGNYIRVGALHQIVGISERYMCQSEMRMASLVATQRNAIQLRRTVDRECTCRFPVAEKAPILLDAQRRRLEWQVRRLSDALFRERAHPSPIQHRNAFDHISLATGVRQRTPASAGIPPHLRRSAGKHLSKSPLHRNAFDNIMLATGVRQPTPARGGFLLLP